MRRRLLAAAALVLLLTTAGCASILPGGESVDEERLAEDASYDWDTDADVTINHTGGDYRAVYRVENRSSLAVSEFQRLDDRAPLPIAAIAFRYPNGTVVGAEAMTVEANGTHTVVTFPAAEGQFAYRVDVRGKEVHVATAVDGSYEFITPPSTRVRYPLVGRVTPDGYETTLVDDRVHIRWDDLTDDRIVVRFYLVRDFYIFAGLLAAGAAGAVVGLAYFYLQLRSLRERRDAVDVERGEG